MTNLSARDIVAAARVRVLNKHPYFASALFQLRPVEREGYGTLCVDKGWRLWYDPDKVTEWGPEGTASVIAHAVQHCLRLHDGRFPAFVGSRAAMVRIAKLMPGSPEPEVLKQAGKLFNAAADAEINDDVVAAGWKLPGESIMPAQFGSQNGLTAEEYGDILLRQWEEQEPQQQQQSGPGKGKGKGGTGQGGQPPPKQPGESKGEGGGEGQGKGPSQESPGCGGSCGSCAGGDDGDTGSEDAPDVPEPMNGPDQQTTRRQVASQIQEHARTHGRGTVPAGLQLWADNLMEPPKVDWRRALAAHVRNAIAMASGADDYSYTRVSRRWGGMSKLLGRMAPILPAMRRPIPKVVIVLDTSGSMGGVQKGPLHDALMETLGIVRVIGSPVEVLATDAQVHVVKRVASASDLPKVAVGGGGTDMRIGIKKAVESKPDVIIVLTDGYTPWPEQHEKPRARLIAAVIGDCAVPDHIHPVIRIEERD